MNVKQIGRVHLSPHTTTHDNRLWVEVDPTAALQTEQNLEYPSSVNIGLYWIIVQNFDILLQEWMPAKNIPELFTDEERWHLLLEAKLM